MTRIGELRSEWRISCAVSMDDERVRWGRKYLRFTWIVLSIRLVGYNRCVLCCSFLLMEWTWFNIRHWSIKNCHLPFYEGGVFTILNCVRCTTCSVKWYLHPLESPSMIFQQILIRSSRSKHTLWNMDMEKKYVSGTRPFLMWIFKGYKQWNLVIENRSHFFRVIQTGPKP